VRLAASVVAAAVFAASASWSAGVYGADAAASTTIPQTEGWVLVASRCVICHSVEIAVQQRQGPRGWTEIVDRMVSYGMPLAPDERDVLIGYLVRHFGDPEGR
jgi:cytochrome c2